MCQAFDRAATTGCRAGHRWGFYRQELIDDIIRSSVDLNKNGQNVQFCFKYFCYAPLSWLKHTNIKVYTTVSVVYQGWRYYWFWLWYRNPSGSLFFPNLTRLSTGAKGIRCLSSRLPWPNPYPRSSAGVKIERWHQAVIQNQNSLPLYKYSEIQRLCLKVQITTTHNNNNNKRKNNKTKRYTHTRHTKKHKKGEPGVAANMCAAILPYW